MLFMKITIVAGALLALGVQAGPVAPAAEDAKNNDAGQKGDLPRFKDRRDLLKELDKAKKNNVPFTEIKESKPLPDRFNQLVVELIKAKKNDAQVCEALFLATLARFPSDGELRTAVKHVADDRNREEAFRDIAWALLNSKEFRKHITTIQESWTNP